MNPEVEGAPAPGAKRTSGADIGTHSTYNRGSMSIDAESLRRSSRARWLRRPDLGQGLARLRMRAGAAIVDNLFRGLSAAGRLHPMARPDRHQVEVLRDLSYTGSGRVEHRLDIYRLAD